MPQFTHNPPQHVVVDSGELWQVVKPQELTGNDNSIEDDDDKPQSCAQVCHQVCHQVWCRCSEVDNRNTVEGEELQVVVNDIASDQLQNKVAEDHIERPHSSRKHARKLDFEIVHLGTSKAT